MSEPPEVFAPGDQVTWLLRLGGKRGRVIPVDAEVVRLTPKRVWIRITMPDGSQQKRLAKPETLRQREQSVNLL